MTETQRFTRYGEKKQGTANKYYEVEALETEDGRGHWIFRWGRIGYECARPKEGYTYSFEAAKQICLEQWKKKGYTEVTAMQALASAVETLEERKTNGFEAVEIDIPKFHAGTSEGRCKKFCTKWLAKLNLVRASRWDLGTDAYSRQIEGVLKGYCKEWSRITSTKAHGHLADNAAAQTAFRIFFGALKDNTKVRVYGYFQGVGNSY